MSDVTPRAGRLWLLRIGAAVVGCVLLIGVAEVAGRVFIWWRHGVPGKSYGLWQGDAELGAIHAANAYNTQTQTNSYGFRGREEVMEPKPAGSLRVVCYGGSTTYCYNLPDGQTWPERLQAHLRTFPGHRQDQVLNGGHICWSLGHVYLQAKRDLPLLKPDVVVIYVGVNEMMNADFLRAAGYDLEKLRQEGRFGVVATNYDQCRWLKRNSVLIRFLDYEIKARLRAGPARHPDAGPEPAPRALPAGDDFDHTWPWQNFTVLLPQMIDLIRKNGSTPVFVVEAGTKHFSETGYLRFSEKGADLARSLGVAVCDPRPAFWEAEGRRELFYATGVHVSAEGAEILGDQIARTIQDLRPVSTAAALPAGSRSR
jgi:lysophospholipase L1-like esterase